MKKLNLVAVSVLAALSSGTSFASEGENFDYYGYGRAGISTTTDGGEQGCYGSGADGHYTGRLGDECETYLEMGFSKGFTQEAGKSIDINSMLSIETAQGAQFNDYQSVVEPGVSDAKGDIALRQFNVIATGYLNSAPEASIWAGKRYYKRKDVGLLDLFYLNNSGYGAGIENVNTGIGDLSAAWITGDQVAYTGKTNASNQRMVQVNKLDLRLENIELSSSAKLAFALIYGFGDVNQSQDNAGEPSDDGLFLTAELDSNIWNGQHTLVAQYSTDALGDAAWRNASGSKVKTYATWEGDMESSSRLIAYGSQPITQSLIMDYSLLYAQGETKSSSNVAEENPFRISTVISPSYHWDEVNSTRIELGYEKGQESYQVEEQDLFKLMIAQEFSPKISDKFKPTLRAYVGSFFGSTAEENRVVNNAGDDGTIRFGVQASASW